MQLFLTFPFYFVTLNAYLRVILLVLEHKSITSIRMIMDNHYDINTLVSKLLTGEINEEEGEALLQKAENDPSLKDKIEQLMNEDDFIQRYRLYHSIDAEQAKKIFFTSIQEEEEPHPSATFIWLRRIAVAASIVLVLLGTWMYFGKQEATKPAVITAELHQAMERIEQNGMNGATLIVGGKKIAVNNAQAVIAKAEQLENDNALFGSEEIVEGSLVTKKDKEFWMVLDDGTYVHLNYNTKLVYPNHFIGSERKVKLMGEAYFVVAPDAKKRPFIVETANGDVHDYGTEFNVCTTKQEGITSVVLVKGKVGVSSKHGKEYLLKPGEKADLQAGRTPDINKVDINLYTSWNTGNFFFDGCTLDELMEVISHWHNMKVEFASDDIHEMHFTGSIDKYEPLTPTLHAIENITGLKLSNRNGNVIRISHD